MIRIGLILILLWTGTLQSQSWIRDTDVIERWLLEGMELYTNLSAQHMTGDDITQELIRFYSVKHLGITYVGGLLEEPPVETLVISLQGSDCVLFVEHAVAMTMTTLQGETDPAQFASNLALFRYGDGIIDGYASRLHYFSDWLRTNQAFNRIEILFQEDSLPTLRDLHFMTSNRDSYRHLASNDSLFALIQLREQQLNAYDRLHYIPEHRIPEFESRFRTGDILSFVTTIDGLDITHTAIVKKTGTRVGFWHASTTGSVIEDPKTIYEYTRDRRNVSGIIIARPRF